MDRPIGTFVTPSMAGQKNSRLSAAYVRYLMTVLGLVTADIAAFAVANLLFRAGRVMPALQFFLTPKLPALNQPVHIFALVAAAFVFTRYLAGDYSRRQFIWDEARSTTATLTIAACADVFLSAVASGSFAIMAQIWTWAFLFLAVPAFRQVARLAMLHLGLWSRSAALVGSGQAAHDAFLTFSNSLSLGFDVRFIIVDEIADDMAPALKALTHIDLRDPSNIIARLVEMGCEEVVVTSEDIGQQRLDTLIHHLIAAHIGVAIIPALGKLPLVGLSASYFFGKNLLLLQIRNNLSRLPGRLLKRGIDFAVSLALLVVLSPLLAAICFLIKRANEGPAIFVQPRVGLDGREFNCLKFRTMAVDAEAQLARWIVEEPELYRRYVESNFKLADDPRITGIGRWLRRTSLDELPQLVNVLRGQMSLVGPRPLLSREVAEYGIGFELYRAVRPGITGLWQISGRSDTRFCDRVAFDEWYIKNWSLWYDLVILLKTAKTLMRSRGAY